MRNIALAVSLAVLGVGAPTVVQADAGIAQAQTAAAYSDAELRSFATAALDIQRIKDAYEPRIAAAADGDQAQSLMAAAGREMTAAVERQGLTVDRFEQILVAAQSDDTLVGRINERLNAPQSTE